MRLTIEELSKQTKLSIPTLRVYVSRQKLGTKVGNNRYFSQVDVNKLLKGSKRTAGKAAGAGTKARKAASSRKQAKAKSPQARTARKTRVSAKAPAPRVVKPEQKPISKPEQKPRTVKRSFLSRLFGGSKQAPKVSLMQAKKS